MVRPQLHRDAFLQALVARDSAAARRAIDQALEGGLSIADVYLEVLAPALQEVGHRWALGALNVAHEHYATVIAQSLLDRLSERRAVPPKDGRLALVTGTPEEQHALGPRIVADFLEDDGWETLLLGTGPPARDVVELVDQERPDLVALSTTTAGVLPGVVELVSALAALEPRPLIVAGGQFWTAETRAAALEFGADLVLHDVRLLAASVRVRVPPALG
jgi:MerR family transcriptional regulator, light-induced transcriptional regulator